MTVPATEPTTPPTGRSYAMLWALLAAGALIVGLVIHVISQNSPEKQAIHACEQYISDNVLTSPASAKYSEEQFFDTDRPEVAGKVDSQNGYGAMIRSSFRCNMTKTGGVWTVTSGFVI